jgi:hypothetical protein
MVEGSPIPGTFSTKLAPKYLGGDGLIFHDQSVLQSGLSINLPIGFYGEIWHSAGLDGTNLNSDGGDEIDYAVGWSGNNILGGLGIDVGVTYIDLKDLFTLPRKDLLIIHNEVNWQTKISITSSLTPYIKYEGFLPAPEGPKAGNILHLGIRHTWTPDASVFSLGQEIGGLYDNGACGAREGLVGKYKLNLSYKILKNASLDFSTTCTWKIHNASDRQTEVVPSVGLSFNW